MDQTIKLNKMYHKLNPKLLYYMYKSGHIVGYKNICKNNKVAIIQFYDLTRIWILKNELKYFIINIK